MNRDNNLAEKKNPKIKSKVSQRPDSVKSSLKKEDDVSRSDTGKISHRGTLRTESTGRFKLKKETIANVFLYCIWVGVAFYGVQFFIALILAILPVSLDQLRISNELEALLAGTLVYCSILFVVVAVPAMLRRSKLKGKIREIFGFSYALPRWSDIGLAGVAYIVCMASAIGLAVAVQILFPSIDMTQAQSLPFDQSQFYMGLTLVWIYLTLAIAAPVAEELLFRGYLFGKIRKYLPASATIVITALVFSFFHVVGVGDDGSFRAQWNVVMGLLPLAIGLGILREYTGSVWASLILHSIQNTVSFVLLFVVSPALGI